MKGLLKKYVTFTVKGFRVRMLVPHETCLYVLNHAALPWFALPCVAQTGAPCLLTVCSALRAFCPSHLWNHVCCCCLPGLIINMLPRLYHFIMH